jgi:pyruvate formate lyase activating enzyme
MSTVSLGFPTTRCAVVELEYPSEDAALVAELRHAELEGIRDGSIASVHSWELVTAVDGPGTRMTLFLNGCPLRCQYCQNPDTWRMRDGIVTPLAEVMDRVKHYKHVFDATGGGLTISGGEPLMQPAFVRRVFAECHAIGVRTALDTSGFLGRKASEELLANTDLVLLDVKSGLPEIYRDVTGVDLQPTIDFGDRLAELKVPVWVRFVLVPGLTDAVENIAAVADIIERWPNVERVEVLPFHQMGENKWERLGIDYTLKNTTPPAAALVDAVQQQFRARGLATY